MFDFDPRDYDSRDDERHGSTPNRGNRGASDDRDRDDDWRQPDFRPRDRDDDDARTLGRGPGNDRQASDDHRRDHRDEARWGERDRDGRERDREGRDTFTRHLHLPRGLERELVRDPDREYTLRGSESRTLATVGAFRVVSSRDLWDHHDRPADPRSGDLRHLREQGLIQTVRVPGYRDHAVVLTKEGRGLLESHRDRDHDHQQTFHSGLVRERELEHDVQNLKGLYEMNNAMANALEDVYAELYGGTLFPEFADEREQQIGREAVRREILSRFAAEEFTIEDVKLRCMQETDCVLKEGEYRKLVSDMRKSGQLERLDKGPMTKDARFRVRPDS